MCCDKKTRCNLLLPPLLSAVSLQLLSLASCMSDYWWVVLSACMSRGKVCEYPVGNWYFKAQICREVLAVNKGKPCSGCEITDALDC